MKAMTLAVLCGLLATVAVCKTHTWKNLGFPGKSCGPNSAQAMAACRAAKQAGQKSWSAGAKDTFQQLASTKDAGQQGPCAKGSGQQGPCAKGSGQPGACSMNAGQKPACAKTSGQRAAGAKSPGGDGASSPASTAQLE